MFNISRFSPSFLNTLFRRLQSRVGQSDASSALTFAFLVVLLTLPAMWPFYRESGYWVSHDGLFHLYRLLSLEEAWRLGYFYPRTFPDFAFGYGFAVLNFYGPLTYYVALALRLIGFSSIGAMKAAFALSYPLSALAIWWLARDLWRFRPFTQNQQTSPHRTLAYGRIGGGLRGGLPNEIAGLVAAAVYTYVPYHMADVQLRGALAESWAFVWWPVLFWAVWRMRVWPLAFALAALVVTHNLSVVLVAFPLVAWALLALWYGRGERLKESRRGEWEPLRLGLAGVIALGITAFYWLPVTLESQYVWIAQDVGGLGFEGHLAPLQTWITSDATYRYFPNQGVQAEHPLSWAQVALLAFALLMGIYASRNREGHALTSSPPHPLTPSPPHPLTPSPPHPLSSSGG